MREEVSAGGIVVHRKTQISPQKNTEEIEILVCQHSQHHGWVFPKGHIGDTIQGESKEEAALREVKEETGITGKILHPLPPVDYWYQFVEEKRHKTVWYFVMEYVSGDTNSHDFEMEQVEWLPIDNVEERLTYESDKKAWREARSLIDGLPLTIDD